MLFRVESTSTGRATHCGVLEFVAEEGVVYMPHWVGAGASMEVCCAAAQHARAQSSRGVKRRRP